jgi:invasion protein IalB
MMSANLCLHSLAAVLVITTTTTGLAQQSAPASRSPPVPTVQQPAGAAAALPNGASSINEVYGEWTVDCRIIDRQKQCVLSQVQGNRETGQRRFAIELRSPKDGKTEGTVVMPFGLNLDAGALLKLDDKDLGKGVRFSTCVPQGCLLPISFPTVATDAMRKGSKLVVASLNQSTNEPVTFTVSLDGFSAALTRTIELAK